MTMRVGADSATRTAPSRGAQVVALARASHFGPTVAVTTFAAALAAGVGAPGRTTTMVAAAVLAGQLSVGWSNDWLDAARDRAVGRHDKPVVTGRVGATSLRTAATAALVGCVVLSSALGWRPGGVHLAAVAGAWAYNLGLKSTVWSWAPYAFSFGILPAVVTLAQPTSALPPWWVVLAGALLGIGAHLTNALPDLEDDESTGVRGLPHRLGRTRSSVAAAVVLLAATAVVLAGPSELSLPLVWAGAVVAVVAAGLGVVVGLVRRTSRVPFTCAIVVAAVDVGLLVAAVRTIS